MALDIEKALLLEIEQELTAEQVSAVSDNKSKSE